MISRQIAFDFGPSSEALATAREQVVAHAVQVECAATPLELPLAPEPGPERASAQLEAALGTMLPVPVRVTLTDNRRTMISLSKRPRTMHVRLHHMFAEADHDTLHALGLYLADADRDAARKIGRYIEQHRARIRRRTDKPLQLTTHGLHHDLSHIYAEVNALYFEGKVDARITWSRDNRVRERAARSIKLGSYLARERLIRVHPALDADYVPRYFVEYIVYHEMLHHVVPARRAGQRRCLHGPEFREREKVFARFDDALRWERDNLERLLTR